MVAWPLMSCFPQVFCFARSCFDVGFFVWKKTNKLRTLPWLYDRSPATISKVPERIRWLFWFNTCCFSSWCFKYFLFSSLPGEDSDFDSYFSKGLVQPPTSFCCNRKKSNGKHRNNLGPAIKNSSAQQDVMIQSISNFVQESAVGNTQRVKNAVDFFCGWYCGWFRSPRSPPKGYTVQNLWIIG